MPVFSASVLRDFVARLFLAAGTSSDEAHAVAESLVESNLHGHDSHGVILARVYLSQLKHGELIAGAPFEVLHETPAMLAADGHLGFGQVQCPRLVEQLIEKARMNGAAVGTIRQCGHVGRLGEWVQRAATAGFAALLAVNDNGVVRTVAPPGGIAARLSTNPIAIAVPTGDRPVVLDISTSVVANGKVKIARLEHREVPRGWIQDAEGNPTTDPHAMIADPPGSLLPFGGEQAFKGFGLGLVFDILVAGLTGGFCPPAAAGTKEWNNVLVIVWDPARWAGQEHFAREADKLLEAVRTCPRKAGVDRILAPGDRSAEVRERRLESGISLDGDVWPTLSRIAENLKVELPAPL